MRYLVFIDDVYLGRALDLDRACLLLADALHFSVAVSCRQRVFVHAGVVAMGGMAIVLPGASGTGKTTLVEALVRAGATYYSDEFAALDADGHVHPYPRPLCVRGPDGERSQRRVEELGGRTGEHALPVGWIVSIRHRPEGRLRLHRLPAGAGFIALFRNTIVARIEPEFALPILGRVASRAIALSGTRPEAEPSAHALLAVLIGDPRTADCASSDVSPSRTIDGVSNESEGSPR